MSTQLNAIGEGTPRSTKHAATIYPQPIAQYSTRANVAKRRGMNVKYAGTTQRALKNPIAPMARSAAKRNR